MNTIRLYLDADAQKGSFTLALRLRGVDVVTANEVGLCDAADLEQLAQAAAHGLALYTFNVGDFMALHTAYLAGGKERAGIIFGEQQRYGVGEQMRRLLRLVQMTSHEGMRNRI